MSDHEQRQIRLAERGGRENKVCYQKRVLESLTIDDFKPHVGSSFRLTEPAADLVLERVGALMESERARLKRQPFSLFFVGPPDRIMPQKIYELRHSAFSEPLNIFLVPVGRTKEGVQYEAVFT
jgi:hypothetical protein